MVFAPHPPAFYLPSFLSSVEELMVHLVLIVTPVCIPPPLLFFHWLPITHLAYNGLGSARSSLALCVCVHSAVSAICTSARPPALKCLFVRQTHC